MSNDNRKSPFSGLTEGDEDDWDKALNAWELPDGATPKGKGEAAPAAKPVKGAVPAPARPLPAPQSPPLPPLPKRPPTEPPRPVGSALTSKPPAAGRSGDIPRANIEFLGDDEDDATVIARVSPELLADAGAHATGERGAGLGQVLGRGSAQTTPPPGESSDALLDMLFEEPDTTTRSRDTSVVTSAPELNLEELGSGPEHRRTIESDRSDEAPEGVLFDPFAPTVPRDERAPTLRPGASSGEEPSTPVTSASASPLEGSGGRVAPPSPRPPRVQERVHQGRDLTPIGESSDKEYSSVEEAGGTLPSEEIRLDSVPPESLPPPPDFSATPDGHTLQGGHGLPEVSFVAADSEAPSVPPSEEFAHDSFSDAPTRDSFKTLEDDGTRGGILDDEEKFDQWRLRASFLEEEARASTDRTVKARGLLVASELFALAHDDTHARDLAVEARDLSPTHPLLHRQARAMSVRDGDWNAVNQALQGESRSAATPAARAHGSIFSAEIARLALGDKELYQKRLEQTIRAAPNDVRGYLNRLATAIGDAEPLPKMRWPEGSEFAPLVDASATLTRWRGAGDRSAVSASPIDALLRARASVRSRDVGWATQALEGLVETAGLSEAATWLSAATGLAHGATDDASNARLERLAKGTHPAVARRALVACALERGRNEDAIAAMTDAPEGAFSAKDLAIVGTLAHAGPEALEKWLEPIDRDPDDGLLSAAIRYALGDLRDLRPNADQAQAKGGRKPGPVLRLARLLAAEAAPPELLLALDEFARADPASALLRVLETEIQIETGRLEALAESLAKAQEVGDNDEKRDRALLAGLVFELAGNSSRAVELYGAASSADPEFEAAARAKIAVSPAEARSALLEEYASSVEDLRTGALLLLEAAHGGSDDPESYSRLLKESYEKAPSLPFASWLAERRARARGDFDNIVEWLHERRQSSSDRVEQAYDLVREALLIADRDLEAARELLEQASLARPEDLALRELYERLSPEPPPDRAQFWASRAMAASGPDRARLALFAAFEYDRADNFEEAARLARISLEAEDSALARICAERNEAKTELASKLAHRLLERAKSSDDIEVRVEAYERLAELDDVIRDDAASAMNSHRAILELRPLYLPSLGRLEQWLIGEGRDDELETVAAELAKALEGSEAAAHAHLAARLRTKAGPWQSGAPYVKLAYSQATPPLWALREMEAHAALANDAATELAVARALIEHTTRPAEIATLCLRGADAASRAGDSVTAKELLTKAEAAYPAHLMVHRAMADLAARTGDFVAAAQAWEAIAELATVPGHKLDANHEAAVIWLDRLNDTVRGRQALEAAAQIDVTYRDVFSRLQIIYVGAADREALAALLENRLASVEDPSERIELEVVRGRTLAEIGDPVAAKRALSFALEASPDHPDALAAFADLSLGEEDWTGAEQALIRLVRLVPDTARQASIYTRLGALYDDRLPNPERAELAYREVLRRSPGDVTAQEKLVAVYKRTGDSAKAIEMQQALLLAAKTPETRRARTVELAIVYEQVGRDPKKAEALLEAARKEFPTDVELLSAVAAFHTRANRLPALHVLLDRAAGDARRALATGRFDVSLFAMLGAVAKLRDRVQGARIAEATVAAIEGRPSELAGAENRAADSKLDDFLAPELLTPAFRSLLNKSGEILDAANPVDLKGLRAVPMPQPPPPAGVEIKELGAAFGLPNLEVFVSPALGAVCIPVGSHPPQIVIGQPLMGPGDDDVRRFLVRRALKAVQVRASALARSAPIDLLPLVSAYLLLFAPDWQPTAVDPVKVRDVHARLLKAKPKRVDDDVGMLALEVIGALGNRASTLHTVVNGWGNRVALLACGDLSMAFNAIARAAGHPSGPAPSGPERTTWINRNAEARDLAVFSVSDAYAEVRSKLGI